MPKKYFASKDSWENRHLSFKQKIEGYYDFDLYAPNEGLKEYKLVSKEFQSIIAHAVQTRKTLRAMGSSWSLSKVGVTGHRLINTKKLRLGLTLPKKYTSSSFPPGDPAMLRFFECGCSIKQVNRELFQAGLSLKASGSNNGQTLSGAVSTNTHGSAFKFGATPDFVVGIHLITGPSKQVYLERESYPVVTKKFAEEKLGADLVRNDTLFNAALVSFGSFGIIHGLMIEARELFLLHASRSFGKFNPALKKAISKLDFSDLELPKPASKLYHFQVTLNPNEMIDGNPPKEAAVYFMFEDDYTPNYDPPDLDDDGPGPGAAGLEIIGALYDLIPSALSELLKPLLNKQVRGHLEPYKVTGTVKELFGGEKTQGPAFASGIGLPLSRSLDALSVAFDTYANFGAVLPVLFTMRFVKGTKALLGFTKFEPTCVLEIDGINTKKMREYANAVWNNLEQAGIPFTMHWGKLNSFLTKARVKQMYGENVNKWIESRETLLSPDVRKVFTNDFLKSVGLAT